MTNKKLRFSKFGFAIQLITLLAFVGVLFFIFSISNSNDEKYKLELNKISYQFLLIVVVGGAISLLFNLYSKSREEKLKIKEKEEIREKELKALHLKFYKEFIDAKNEVKRIRRFLRARCRITSQTDNQSECVLIETKRYDALLQELILIQLKFEFFEDELIANPNLFSGHNLSDLIRIIKEYLNDLITEYEDLHKEYPNQSVIDEIKTMELDKMPFLKGLMDKFELTNEYSTRFKIPSKLITMYMLETISIKSS